jgi:hypothetical protein
LAVEVVAAPEEGVWRVGREPDLLSASVSTKTSRAGKPNTGNCFDSPTGAYGVRYFASDLDGCYGETLARFRADKKLAKVIGAEWSDLGFMNVGDIPADWRQRRGAIRVRFPAGGSSAAGPGFLDIESLQTREAFLPDLEPLLKFYGYADLDVAVVRGHDRRVTRYISQWTYEQVDEEERPIYAGIRYLSRLNSDWELWAVFDNVAIEEMTRRAILPHDEALQRVAKTYGLTVY